MSNPKSGFTVAAAIPPASKGLVSFKDAIPAGKGLTRQFTVNDVKGVGFAKFVNEDTAGSNKARTATISTGEGNTGTVVATYSGRDTGTDEMFAQFMSKNHPESAASKLYQHLDPKVPYYLNYWNDDGSGSPCHLGFNNNNNL